MLNKVLKAKIVEKFGSQADFAMAIGEDETIISRVIRGRRTLDPIKKKIWAEILECTSEDIFREKHIQ